MRGPSDVLFKRLGASGSAVRNALLEGGAGRTGWFGSDRHEKYAERHEDEHTREGLEEHSE